MSATWGKNFKVSIFGESHGSHIGIVIDGIPAGTEIDMDYINSEMERRAPGRNRMSTARNEDDRPEIISGVFNGRATGAPVTMIIKNRDHRSKDYSQIKDIMRPGHADYTANKKYGGYNDYRGGGHFSGRITAPLVFAGAIARKILEDRGVFIGCHVQSIGSVCDRKFQYEDMTREVFSELRNERIPLLDSEKSALMEKEVEEARLLKDSIGGVAECAVIGVGAGVGNPFFESVESVISSMMFSIPAVKGIEFGSGFEMAKMKGSSANDSFYFDNGDVKTKTNHNGGINGGITNGMPVVFRLAIKPTSSIALKQNTINIKTGENVEFELTGRHDPVIVLRAVPVIEAATAICILDMMIQRELDGLF